MNTEYYGSYPQEEVLVDVQTCGGYDHYPICLYDFTPKILIHDHLVFSTRHLIHTQEDPTEETKSSQSGQLVTINPKYIDWNYCKKKCKESCADSDATE